MRFAECFDKARAMALDENHWIWFRWLLPSVFGSILVVSKTYWNTYGRFGKEIAS